MDNLLKIEAILFSYGDFVTFEELEILTKIELKKLKKLLEELKEKYQKEEFSFEINIEKERVKMEIKEEFQKVINQFLTKDEITKPILKTLSIIAYEGPLTKTKLTKILGRTIVKDVEYLFVNLFINFKKKGIGKYYFVTSKFHTYFKIDKDINLRENLNKKLEEFDKKTEEELDAKEKSLENFNN